MGQDLYFGEILESTTPDFFDPTVEVFHSVGATFNPTHQNFSGRVNHLTHIEAFSEFEGEVLRGGLHILCLPFPGCGCCWVVQ